MSAPQTTLQLLEQVRAEGPSYYKRLSDEALYYKLRNQNKINDLQIWNEADKKFGYGKHSQASQENLYKDESDINTLQQYADLFISDDSYDWVKAAYNRSLTGNVEKLITGEQRYDIDDTDFNLLEDIGASLLSFIMPLDAISMFTGGLAGKALSKGLAKGMANKANSQILKKLPKSVSKWTPEETSAVMSTLSRSQKMLVGATGQAPALAVYEGAMGGVQAQINGDNVLGGITYGVLHGGFLGGVTGAVGTGLGGLQARLLQKGKKEALTGFEKFRAYGAYGMPGQVLGESLTFTGINTAERMYHAIQNGEDVDAKAILRDFYHDVGMTTFLKGKQKVMKYGSDVINDIKNATKAEIAKKRDIESKTEDLKDKVKDSINENPNISDKNKDEINAAFDKDAISVDVTLKEKTKSLDNLDLELKLFLEYLEEGVFTDKDVAQKQLTKLKNILIESNGVIDNYLKEKGGSEADIVYASNLEKRARKAMKDFSNIDEYIDKKFDEHLKAKREQASIVKPFGFKNIEEAKENSMTLTPKEIINEANKYGIDAEGKLDTKESRDVIIDRIYQSKLSAMEMEGQIGKAKTKEIAEAISPQIEETLGMTTEPETGRKLNISKQKYKKHIKETKESLDKDYIEGTVGDISKKTVQEIQSLSKTLKDDPLIPVIVSNSMKNLAKKTLQQDKPRIKNFFKWLDKKKIDIMDISESDIVKYFKDTKGKELKELYPADAAPLVRIFNWMGSKKGLNWAEDPTAGMKGVFDAYNKSRERRKKELPDTPTFNKNTESIIKSLKKEVANKEVGDSASLLLKIAHESGVRNQEFFTQDVKGSAIKVGDFKHIKNGKVLDGIDTSKEAINFINMRGDTSKTNRERYIPISSKTAKEINTYIEKYNLDKTKDLFKESNKDSIRKEINKRLKDFYDKANIDDVRDVLQIEMYYKTEFKESKDYQLLNNLLGHQMTAIDKIYTKDISIAEMVKDSYDSLSKIWNQRAEKVSKEKQQKVTPELQYKIDTGIEAQVKQKEYFESIPAYKKITINLKKKFGNNKGNRILGRIRNHVIDIADGKVRIDTIPHEVSHYVVDVLNQFGTNKDRSLIKRGINFFAKDLKRGEIKTVDSKGKETIKKFKESKEAFRERKEELLVQRVGELAAGQITNRTMVSKFKNWVKAVNARMKEFFGIANKDDVAFILSRRVVKGNIPKGKTVENYINGLKDHFQTVKDDPVRVKRYNKELHKKENELIDAGLEGGRKFLNEVRELYDIEPSGTGRKVTDTPIASYERYLQELESIAETMPKIKKGETMIERLATEYKVTEAELSNIVISLGEPSGIPSKMSKKAQAYIRQYIKNHGEKTERKPVSVGEMTQLSGDKLTWIQGVGKAFLPAYYVIQKHGGKAGEKLANRILGFDVALHTEFKGIMDVHIHNIKKILGGKKSDYVRNFDIERSKALLKAEKEGKTFGIKMSAEEKQFIKDMKIEGTDANLAYKEHKEFTKFVWEKLGLEVKKITNKAEYEKFLKEYNELYVTDYNTRKLTKEAFDHFTSEKSDSKHVQAIVEDNIKRAASQDAINYAKRIHKGSKNITNNHSKNMTINKSYKKTYIDKYNKNLNSEKLKTEIADNVLFSLTQQHSKVKNTYLMPRGPLIPEYIQITKRNGQKKIIQTYESSISKSIDPYVAGMSKYLATLRFFPEYTALGGIYTIGSSKVLQLETLLKNKEIGQYAKDTIERMIGVYK